MPRPRGLRVSLVLILLHGARALSARAHAARNGRRHVPVAWSHHALSRRAAIALPVISLGPSLVRADDPQSPPEPRRSLYLVMRVMEATSQEERLIKSGKFKDVQRNNIKFAVRLMLDNYKLGDSIVDSSQLAATNAQADAARQGREAVETLNTLLDYFDADDKSLQVTKLSPEKLNFAVKAFSSARTQLNAYLEYMPPAEVEKSRNFITYENELNEREYKRAIGKDTINAPPDAPPPAGATAAVV